jgi:hypothetical protein
MPEKRCTTHLVLLGGLGLAASVQDAFAVLVHLELGNLHLARATICTARSACCLPAAQARPLPASFAHNSLLLFHKTAGTHQPNRLPRKRARQRGRALRTLEGSKGTCAVAPLTLSRVMRSM